VTSDRAKPSDSDHVGSRAADSRAGDSRNARAHSLVLRLWPEPRDFEGQQPLWRGSLADLDGANTRYFDNGRSLCKLLAELTGANSLRCPGPAA